MKANRSASQGFTLIELLVVIAIGAIITTLSIGAYQQIVKSSTLTGAAQTLAATLDLARQTAITRNADVEVRLYQLPAYSSSSSATPTSYRALQTFLVTDTGTTALSKVIFLPTPTVMQSDPLANSTLLDNSQDTNLNLQTGSTLNQPLPSFQNNYNSMAFRFTPKGSLNVSTTKQWFLTIVFANDKLSANNFPSNYVMLQIDPFTGRTRIFRP